LRRDVKRDLADAIMACLEKDPDWRPKDLSYVRELVRDLPRAAPPKLARAVARPSTVPAAAVPSFGARRAAPANRLPLVLGMLLVIVAGGGLWFWLNRGGAAPLSPPPSLAARPATPEPAPALEPSPSAPPTATPAAATTPAPVATLAPTAPPTATPTPLATPPPLPPPSANPAPRMVEVPIVTPTQAPPEARVAPIPTQAPPPEVSSTPTAVSAPEAAEPAVLTTVNPASVRRRGIAILDLRGSGFRADLRAIVFRGREIPTAIAVVRQRLVNPGLMQVGLQVDEAAAPGAYSIGLTDAQGRTSNTLKFEVAK
jgi:hypothetical protein